MPIIDLSLSLYSGMPVFPGDPDVSISKIFTIEDTGWNMSRMEMNTHDATHVNVPIHAKKWWKNLDDYDITDFIWPARMYESTKDILPNEWLIFHTIDITMDIAEKIVQIHPPFIGLPQKYEFDLAIEKFLLEHDIISYERLINTELLPKKFMFYGVPLRIKDGDGSPVRAYAISDN
jgi:arylformamidase